MKVRKIPRGTFWIGGLSAVALGLPLTTLALHVLAGRVLIGRTEVLEVQIGILALIFAGLPAFLTGGGVARLVAHRLAERDPLGGGRLVPVRALAVGAAAMALCGVGLMLLTVVPLGGLPERPVKWWPLGAAGIGIGIVTGLAIAVLVGARTQRWRRQLGPAAP
jgi:hypothetical protein